MDGDPPGELSRVGAVTGNPRVRNRTSLLAKIQVGEYSNIIGLIKRTQRILGKVLTVSGVIAAYRKSAVIECGLFDSDTVTEASTSPGSCSASSGTSATSRGLCAGSSSPRPSRACGASGSDGHGGVEVLRRHLDIWKDHRHRRLIPVYIEYCLGLLWAHTFMAMVFLWLFFVVMDGVCRFAGVPICEPVLEVYQRFFVGWNPLYPAGTGAILGFACLCESVDELLRDYRYENKAFAEVLLLRDLAPRGVLDPVVAGGNQGSLRSSHPEQGGNRRWKSPDRGLHTLKSSSKTK